MARYTIDFSTNADYIIREIERVNAAVAKVARTGKKVVIDLDTTSIKASFDATFKQLDRQIAQLEAKLSRLPIGGRKFQQQATAIGVASGIRERGGMQARAIQLGAEAEAFDVGSAVQLRKQLEAASIEAAQIAPDTEEWVNFQRQIGQIKLELRAADRLAENIQLTENLGAFSPGSLNALEAKLTVLRNRAKEISPNTSEWKELNKEIVKVEQGIQRQTRKPLTKGQRFGAAGGAFLYGGGLGGGAGSALGGVAGGLMGGVPGAFTGAAIGQLADNLGTALAGITSQASALQQMQRGLAMASIDAKDFAEAQATVASMSQRLLMPLEQATRLFTQLRVNTKQYNLSVDDTARIMEGTALAIMATGGSSEDLEGAMRAVVQIMSKGGVQAEELRGQLGERFPGAVVKFAQANKLSFEELQKGLEQGQIGIKEFVAFAEKNYTDYASFSKQLATAPEFAGRRLQIALEEISREVGALFAPVGAQIQDALTEAIKEVVKFIKENRDSLRQFIADWSSIVGPILRILGQLLGVLARFGAAVAKIFTGLFAQIRQAIGMATIGEAKARLVKAQKATKGLTRPTGNVRGGGPFRELDQAQQQYKALGGDAAFKGANAPLTPSNLTFGGAGANMPLEREGKPGSEKTKKGKKDKTIEDITAGELDLRLRLGVAQQTQNKAQEAFYTKELALLEIAKQKLPQNKKIAETMEAVQRYAATMKDIDKEITEEKEKQQKVYADLMQSVQDQIELAGAATEEDRQRIQLEHQIRDLRRENKFLTDEQIAAFKLLNEQLMQQKKIQDDLNRVTQMREALFQGIANELVGGISAGIDAVTSSTKNLGEALQEIGQSILSAVGKMLIFYALAQAFGALSGGNSNSFFGFLAQGFGYKFAEGGYVPGGFQAFADGGMVDRPTMGLVGEGGEAEYIIPASKMRSAMNRYAAGARGSAVIPGNGESDGGPTSGLAAMNASSIDVRYTVERINSVDYVTADQFRAGMAQAAQQGATQGEQRTLRRLQQSRATRSRLGMN